jgi:hypothetical protein
MAEATASTMGSIMATVAVLEIHIDRNAVVAMNPSMIIFGEVPTWAQCYKTFYLRYLRMFAISWSVCLRLFQPSLMFVGSQE